MTSHIPQTASQRSLIRSVRIARTLADIHDREKINSSDLIQAWKWQPESAAHARGDFALGLA